MTHRARHRRASARDASAGTLRRSRASSRHVSRARARARASRRATARIVPTPSRGVSTSEGTTRSSRIKSDRSIIQRGARARDSGRRTREAKGAVLGAARGWTARARVARRQDARARARGLTATVMRARAVLSLSFARRRTSITIIRFVRRPRRQARERWATFWEAIVSRAYRTRSRSGLTWRIKLCARLV